MKTQTHAMKHCQELAKPTGGDIISNVKPCWPIRSMKMFPVGVDNGLRRHKPKTPVLKIFILAGVFKMFDFSDLVLRLRVDEHPNRIEKAAVLKITEFMWTGP